MHHMKSITFEDLQSRYDRNDIVKCLTTGKSVEIRGIDCIIGIGDNQKGYATGVDFSKIIVYKDGEYAEVVSKGFDEHEAHIQRVLDTCKSLGTSPSELLKMDYMHLLR